MEAESYIPYREFAAHLEIGKGDIIWLAADLMKLAFSSIRKEGAFDTKIFINGFQQLITEEGMLAIPAFNFTLQNNAHFSHAGTIPITGSLAVDALHMEGFHRTSHPLHSFLVWGKNADALTGLQNQSSFGNGSPFEFFYNSHGKMIILGTSITNAFTFVHFVEEMQQVRYRKYKKINIFLEDYNRWGEFALYAKRPGWTMDLSGLEKLLISQKVALKTEINGIHITTIDLYKSFSFIKDDIVENHARNISRFGLDIYFRDIVKPVIAKIGYRTKAERIRND